MKLPVASLSQSQVSYNTQLKQEYREVNVVNCTHRETLFNRARKFFLHQYTNADIAIKKENQETQSIAVQIKQDMWIGHCFYQLLFTVEVTISGEWMQYRLHDIMLQFTFRDQIIESYTPETLNRTTLRKLTRRAIFLIDRELTTLLLHIKEALAAYSPAKQ